MSLQRIFNLAVCFAGIFLGFTAAQAQTVQFVPLTANHIAYSPVTGKIYATVPNTAAANADRIVVVDPATASVSATIPLVSSPNRLAVSDDGSTLYAGLDSDDGIQRVNLATHRPDYFIPLGRTANGPYTAYDLAVQPGHPHTLAVSRVVGFTDGNVAIFDDSAMRPVTFPFNPAVLNSTITFGAWNVLYVTGYTFDAFQVAPSGLLPQSAPSALIYGKLDYSLIDRLVYSSGGVVADLNKQSVNGTFTSKVIGAYGTAQPFEYVPDPADHRAYSLGYTSNGDTGEYEAVITAYDTTTYLMTGTFVVPIPFPGSIYGNAPSDLLFLGNNRLAFLTYNGIYLVNGVSFPSLQSFTLSNDRPQGGDIVTATLTLTQPAPPAGATYAITGLYTDDGITPQSIAVAPGQTTASFAFMINAETTYNAYSLTAAYGTDTQTVNFIVHPAGSLALPSYLRYVPLPVSRMVASPLQGLLYASTSVTTTSQAGLFPGNSLYTINPATGAHGTPLFLGSDPTTLAISGDATTLYAGIAGADSVARVNIQSAANGHPSYKDYSFGLFSPAYMGPVPAEQIAVVPGKPHSLAVVRNLDSDGSELDIYDDSVPRAKGIGFGDISDDVNVIAFDQIGTHLYGSSTFVDYNTLFEYGVSSQGLSRPTQFGNAGAGNHLVYDDGRLYTDVGQVYDAASEYLDGEFYGVSYPTVSSALVAPDTAHGRVYFLTTRPNNSPSEIDVYDALTYLPLGSYPLPNGLFTSDFVLYAPGKLAFIGAGGVFLVDLSSSMI